MMFVLRPPFLARAITTLLVMMSSTSTVRPYSTLLYSVVCTMYMYLGTQASCHYFLRLAKKKKKKVLIGKVLILFLRISHCPRCFLCVTCIGTYISHTIFHSQPRLFEKMGAMIRCVRIPVHWNRKVARGMVFDSSLTAKNTLLGVALPSVLLYLHTYLSRLSMNMQAEKNIIGGHAMPWQKGL